MSKIERILVVIDPEERRTTALRRGVELARRLEAELHLSLFVFDRRIDATASVVHPDVMRLAKQQFLSEHLAWLSEEAAALADRGLRVECDVIWAPSLYEAVVAKTRELSPVLVIKDVGRDLLSRSLFFVAEDWRLVRYCPEPLMLVQPDSPVIPHRVLAAVDTWPSLQDARSLNSDIVKNARELGVYCGSDVHLLHVIPQEPMSDAAHPAIVEAYEDVEQADQDAFNQFAQDSQIDEEHRHLLRGRPVEALRNFIQQEGFELLVVGTHYRGGLERLFLGSTSEGLLRRVGCDVLLLRPADFLQQLGRHFDLEALVRTYRRDNDLPLEEEEQEKD